MQGEQRAGQLLLRKRACPCLRIGARRLGSPRHLADVARQGPRAAQLGNNIASFTLLLELTPHAGLR